MKGGIGLCRKIFDGDRYLSSIFFVYKEKIVNKDLSEERSVHTNSESCNIRLGS